MKTFEDLDCWKKAAALRRKAANLAKALPPDTKGVEEPEISYEQNVPTNN